MATKIAIFNQKGGVGKTTSSKAIAGELSKNHDKKVLLIDCDSSANATNGIDYQSLPPIYLTDLIHQYCSDLDIDIYELSEQAFDAICKTEFDRLDLMPAKKEKMIIANRELSTISMGGSDLFRDLLSIVDSKYDYIIIDVAAGGETKMCENALTFADYVIAPCEADEDSLDAYFGTIQKIKEAKRQNRKLKSLGVFLTKYNQRNPKARAAYEILNSQTAVDFIPVIIPFSNEVGNARSLKKPLCYHNAVGKTVIQRYAELTDYIVKKISEVNNG